MPSFDQKTFEGFSVSHAAILDGTTRAELVYQQTGVDTLGGGGQLTGEFWDVYGVRDAALTVNEGMYDNTGDDAVLSSWFWFNYVDVAVKSGFIPFDTLSGLTGSPITTISSAGTGNSFSLPLWEISSLNQPRRPMLIRVPSKDAAGATRTLDFVLYSVQFQPLKFTGPTYKTGLEVDYSGRALISNYDETGLTLNSSNPYGQQRAIGRLISVQGEEGTPPV